MCVGGGINEQGRDDRGRNGEWQRKKEDRRQRHAVGGIDSEWCAHMYGVQS